jgi:hypothetical protein
MNLDDARSRVPAQAAALRIFAEEAGSRSAENRREFFGPAAFARRG